MFDNKVQQNKEQHPADGSDRWTVTGELGKVCYDVLGNHLAVIDEHGDVDSVMGATLARVAEYARLDDDDAMFAALADVYRTVLAGEPAPVPGSLVARALNALAAFGVQTEREAGKLLPMWLHFSEMTDGERAEVLDHYRPVGAR